MWGDLERRRWKEKRRGGGIDVEEWDGRRKERGGETSQETIVLSRQEVDSDLDQEGGNIWAWCYRCLLPAVRRQRSEDL